MSTASRAPDPRPGPAVRAVVVTHRPDVQRLAAQFEALRAQVDGVVVVDNGSPPLTVAALAQACPGAVVLPQGRNTGVAAAQNTGIRHALDAGATGVVLLDQDSVPAPGMVHALLAARDAAEADGLRVAAVAARQVAPSGQARGFVTLRWGLHVTRDPAEADPWAPVDVLISSGTLLTREALVAVGLMAEGLFIDKVDTEWCLRAAARGWRLVGAPRARLHHVLGERVVARPGLGDRRPVHKPFRYYYMIRNSVLIHRLPWVPLRWRLADVVRFATTVVQFGLVAPGRGAALRMMARGLRDGVRGRTGPLPDGRL